MYMCRLCLPYDNTWEHCIAYTNLHFITTTVTQLPRTPLTLRRAIQQPTCFLYYLWDTALYHSTEPGGLIAFLFPFILLSYLMETGAKNKRPQALPRAKESVMIPTLLMNITRTRKQQQHKVNTCLLSALGFFTSPASLFFCFFLYLICYRAAWKTAEEIGQRHTVKERKKERKKGKNCPGWHRAGRYTHTGMCDVWQLLALSRLVRSSLSFFSLPLARREGRTPECNRGFCYRLSLEV
jgi:hypothetical protein